MSNYKLTKLDRRYNGFGVYDYMIEPNWGVVSTDRQARFIGWRVWAWSNFGPGCELELVKYMPAKPKWAWTTEFNNLRLYLNDEALVVFKLKF